MSCPGRRLSYFQKPPRSAGEPNGCPCPERLLRKGAHSMGHSALETVVLGNSQVRAASKAGASEAQWKE